jgi:carbon monoxide dehydrogenase subunit G
MLAAEPILGWVRAELTIEIARTPDDVFAYLTDVSNLPAWQAGVKSATMRDGRIDESRSVLGRELHTTLEIVEREEPRLFTLRALDSPVPFTVRHELEPADDGTRLTVTAEGDVPGFAAGLLARRAERQFRKDFERLKRNLES